MSGDTGHDCSRNVATYGHCTHIANCQSCGPRRPAQVRLDLDGAEFDLCLSCAGDAVHNAPRARVVELSDAMGEMR